MKKRLSSWILFAWITFNNALAASLVSKQSRWLLALYLIGCVMSGYLWRKMYDVIATSEGH